MAGHRRGNSAERLFYAGPAIESFEIARQRPNRCFTFSRIEHGWKRREAHAVTAELFDLESELLERRGVRDEGLSLGRRQVDEQRRQKPLAFERTGGQLLHDLFEQHALVRDMLVDDRDPLVVDRNDEGVAKLAKRAHRPDRLWF